MNKIIVCLLTVLALRSTASAQIIPDTNVSLSAGSHVLQASDIGGKAQYYRLRFTGDSSGSSIDGMTEGAYSDTTVVTSYNGATFHFYNEGTANITIVHHSTVSGVDSTNQISTYTGRDVVLRPGERMTVVADITFDYGTSTFTYHGWHEDVNHTPYVAQTASQPSRSIGTAWQPDTIRATNVVISLEAACSLTLTGGAAGHLDVLVGSTSSPTMVVGSVGCGNTGAVVVGVNSTVTTRSVVPWLVKPGDYVKITTTNTTGTPTFTLLSVTEQPL